MNDVLKIFLSMSLSGSLLILIFFAGKHFLKERVSRQWQYYIWLIVIARLLLPFAPETNLMGTLFQTIDHTIAQSDTVQPSKQNQVDFVNIPDTPPVDGEQGNVKQTETPPVYQPVNDIITLMFHNVWLVWLTVALILFIQKVTVYKSFVRYVEAGQIPISDTELLDRLAVIGEQAGVKKPVELCVNPLMSSPLLIGFFNPCIVLPSTDISEKDFRYIVLHELTHYRRWDMFYKWLVQVTVCLHWFNPLVYLMSREINKACEFSCDEVIISKSDSNSAQEYGKTLLDAMAKAGNYKESLASVTLNENKEMLKERLGAIMSFKKKSKFCIALSILLTIVISFGATVTGAYAMNTSHSNTKETIPEVNTNSTGTKVNIDIEKFNQSEQVTYGPYYLKAGTTWKIDLDWKGGGMISVSCKSSTHYAGEQLVQQIDSPMVYDFTIQEDGEYTFTITNNYATSSKYKLNPFVTDLIGFIYISDKVETNNATKIPISIDTISADEVVCIGQISLDKNISYQCDINAEKGIGLFVGLSTSSDITSIGSSLFYEAYGHNGSGNMINATFSDSKPVTYYVYVGNANRQTNSKLENITGSLILMNTVATIPELKESSSAVVTIPDSKEITNAPISIDIIRPNEVICVGQISLDQNTIYRLDANAESGQGLFVGLSASNGITSIKGNGFTQGYGSSGLNSVVNAYFSADKSITYYVYIGNTGKADINKITGSLYLDK